MQTIYNRVVVLTYRIQRSNRLVFIILIYNHYGQRIIYPKEEGIFRSEKAKKKLTMDLRSLSTCYNPPGGVNRAFDSVIKLPKHMVQQLCDANDGTHSSYPIHTPHHDINNRILNIVSTNPLIRRQGIEISTIGDAYDRVGSPVGS